MKRRSQFDLRRHRVSKSPRLHFYLYCEGKNTETGYFRAIRAMYKNTIVDIEVIGPAGVPKTVAAKAIAHLKKLKLERENGETSSFEDNDEVWAVFDRDEHPCYYDAINLCQDAGVHVARSNPCFEVWLILHESDFDQPIGRHQVQKKLKKLCRDYDLKKKIMNFERIVTKVQTAERRADRQLRNRLAENAKRLGPPYTTAHELTRSIRKAAEKSV